MASSKKHRRQGKPSAEPQTEEHRAAGTAPDASDRLTTPQDSNDLSDTPSAPAPGTGAAFRAGRLPLEPAGPCRYRIPRDARPFMRVPAVVIANSTLLDELRDDPALEQLANVASLPGIVPPALAMPDCHWGYGFPVGGVAAVRASDGVVSPGGIGFDINCGVRLLRTPLREADLLPYQEKLADALYRAIPSGVGSHEGLPLDQHDIEHVLARGVAWAVERGYATAEDVRMIESGGRLAGADPDAVSRRAIERGISQLGTLGSGNHFFEVQVVDVVYDREAAAAMGLEVGQVCIFIHSGSRGLGHQVCQDYLDLMEAAMRRYGIQVPDRQLACVPIQSPEGRRYLAAMQAAANFAFSNRQGLTYRARQAFRKVFGEVPIEIVYDVAHNVAKFERYTVEGQEIEVLVHRKGATRAFPAGHPEIPARYQAVGQPVLIPGDMGRYSFVAVGTAQAMTDTFGSICHGAGRHLSRNAAKKQLRGKDIAAELRHLGILVRTPSPGALAEEASIAYKDVADVVEVCEAAGIARKVVRLRPRVVVKG